MMMMMMMIGVLRKRCNTEHGKKLGYRKDA